MTENNELIVLSQKTDYELLCIETIMLDDKSRDIFLDLLDNPPEPSQTLIDLIEQNRQYLYL